jgi:hypothetical protein
MLYEAFKKPFASCEWLFLYIRVMKKMIFPVLAIILFSCSNKDEQFCKCLQAGEQLNEYSVKLLEGDVTQEKASKLKELKSKQKEACKDYQTMKGDEMLKRKKECAE